MVFEKSMSVLIIFWILVFLFNYREIKKAGKLSDQKDRTLIYWLQAIIFVGVLVRTFDLAYPLGILSDEAINGYDAWCLANYGVDQYLTPYPVYLKSWGSGQSALYAYFALPFVKLFGLSVPVHRLPMALLCSGTIIFFYWTLRKTQKNVLLIFSIISFIVISPWHIMNSRFGMDCNVSPELLLIAVSFFLLAYYSTIRNRQTICYLAACLFIALAAYGYGVSWLMLPIFYIGIFIYLLKKRKITYTQSTACLIFTSLLIVPLVLFAINLFFGGEAYSLGPITITQMDEARHAKTSIIGDDNALSSIIYSLRKGLGMTLWWGADGVTWNSIRFWGQFYNCVSIPFILIYFIRLIRKRSLSFLDSVFFIWLLAMIPVMIVVKSDVNHWNLLWFPLIYFSACGIYVTLQRFWKMRFGIFPLYIILFSGFLFEYSDYYLPKNKDVKWVHPGYLQGSEEPVRFLAKHKFDKIYYSNLPWNTMKFYLPLYYNLISPYEFNATRIKEKLEVKQYANNYFYLPDTIEPQAKTAYVVPTGMLDQFDIKNFNVDRFEYYTVLWNE